MSKEINVNTVLKRLEAVTSRLEDLFENSGVSLSADITNTVSPTATPSAPRAAASAQAPAVAPPQATTTVEDPRSVTEFQETIVSSKVKDFVSLTESFAIPAVVDQAKLTLSLYSSLGSLIRTASHCKKPSGGVSGPLIAGLQKDIGAIGKIKDDNFKERNWSSHLSLLAEGASAVGWVTLDNKPGPYIAEMRDASQFYANRVLKDFKDKEPKHAEWVRAYADILESMRKYVMEYHTTGLVWNAKGVSVDEFTASQGSAAPAPPAGAPPPPPPPPPPAPAPPPPAAAPAASSGGIGAVFADLNRGSDVTKGLRKVDKSEMTHKNPALRASSTVPASTSASGVKKPAKPTKPSALQAKKPPKFALEGNKWVIENQEGDTLTVDNVEKSQVVNLYGCKKTTIVVKGKANAITLVNCKNTSLLVDSVISSVAITNSPSFAVQVTGTVPTIQIDTTDSGTIYLSKDCLDVEITTAKCSAINVNIPVAGEEEGVFDEAPVPEMLLTKVKDGKLITTVVEHKG